MYNLNNTPSRIIMATLNTHQQTADQLYIIPLIDMIHLSRVKTCNIITRGCSHENDEGTGQGKKTGRALA